MSGTAKSVVLTVNSLCFAKNSLAEVLRVAVGLSSGMGAHRVSVLFMGDGAVQALDQHKNADTEPYLVSAKAHGVKLLVDEYSLSLRGLEKKHLIEEMTAVSRDTIIEELEQSQVHLRI